MSHVFSSSTRAPEIPRDFPGKVQARKTYGSRNDIIKLLPPVNPKTTLPTSKVKQLLASQEVPQKQQQQTTLASLAEQITSISQSVDLLREDQRKRAAEEAAEKEQVSSLNRLLAILEEQQQTKKAQAEEAEEEKLAKTVKQTKEYSPGTSFLFSFVFLIFQIYGDKIVSMSEIMRQFTKETYPNHEDIPVGKTQDAIAFFNADLKLFME